MKYDISEIGAINLTLDFDYDEYEEYIQEYNLQNTQDNLITYVRDYCNFDVEYLDSEYFHSTGDYDSMSYDELCNEFGEKLANDALKDCLDGKEHSYEISAYQNDDVNINDRTSLNAAALKYLKHGEYFKGCRGFILTDGNIVYTESEHNQCSKIPGIKGTFHFISLGNIRIMNQGMDIKLPPTRKQMEVINDILYHYEGENFYLELMNDNIGYQNKQYQLCNPNKVINDIVNYFNKLNENNMNRKKLNENKMSKNNTVKLNESQLRKIVAESVKKTLNEWNYDPIYGDYDFNTDTGEEENKEEKPALHWYDDQEHEYQISAMIKSDMNPLTNKFKATSIEDAISQAKKYFVRFSTTGDEKDVDIYFVRHHDFD